MSWAVWIAGFVVLDVLVGLAIFIARSRRAETVVMTAPPSDLPDWVPSMAPSAVDLTPGPGGLPDIGAMIAGIKAAAADGQLTDNEIQAMFPGAVTVRESTTTIAAVQGPGSIHVSVGDGVQEYASVDEIGDPAVREMVRRAMSGATALPPPPPPPPAP